MTTRCQTDGTPIRIRLLLAITTSVTPRIVPMTVPRPPVNCAPPKHHRCDHVQLQPHNILRIGLPVERTVRHAGDAREAGQQNRR